jgi:ankyrin repeat protein
VLNNNQSIIFTLDTFHWNYKSFQNILVKAANCDNERKILPNFNLKDSEGQTVLGLALWSNLHNEAARLLGAGANINEKNSDGLTLLHQSIQKQDTASALFLIEHQADITTP